jgi:hypothetical protein
MLQVCDDINVPDQRYACAANYPPLFLMPTPEGHDHDTNRSDLVPK